MILSTLCYIEKDDQYLMLHRTVKENDVNKDKWIGLGGKFESKESPEECLLREIKEEAGICLTSYHYRGIVTFVSDEWDTEYMSLYTADAYEGELTSCDEGELEWVKKSDLTKLNLWLGDRIFFELLTDNEPFFSLKLQYEKENLVSASLNGKALEFFDLLNEDGTKTGISKPRMLVHQDGDLHGTSHVWVVRKKEDGFDLLLQKRSATKDAFAGYLDVSSAGHLDPREEYLDGAIRELREELGISAKPEELKFVGMHRSAINAEFYGKPFNNNELSGIFLYEVGENEVSFTLQQEEVESVQWMDYYELCDQIKNNTLKHCIELEELQLLEKNM